MSNPPVSPNRGYWGITLTGALHGTYNTLHTTNKMSQMVPFLIPGHIYLLHRLTIIIYIAPFDHYYYIMGISFDNVFSHTKRVCFIIII